MRTSKMCRGLNLKRARHEGCRSLSGAPYFLRWVLHFKHAFYNIHPYIYPPVRPSIHPSTVPFLGNVGWFWPPPLQAPPGQSADIISPPGPRSWTSREDLRMAPCSHTISPVQLCWDQNLIIVINNAFACTSETTPTVLALAILMWELMEHNWLHAAVVLHLPSCLLSLVFCWCCHSCFYKWTNKINQIYRDTKTSEHWNLGVFIWFSQNRITTDVWQITSHLAD